MKSFFRMLGRYIPPYRKYVVGSVVMNILSALFNIFSFSLVIPILNILFQLNSKVYEFIPWNSDLGFKEKLINNA